MTIEWCERCSSCESCDACKSCESCGGSCKRCGSSISGGVYRGVPLTVVCESCADSRAATDPDTEALVSLKAARGMGAGSWEVYRLLRSAKRERKRLYVREEVAVAIEMRATRPSPVSKKNQENQEKAAGRKRKAVGDGRGEEELLKMCARVSDALGVPIERVETLLKDLTGRGDWISRNMFRMEPGRVAEVLEPHLLADAGEKDSMMIRNMEESLGRWGLGEPHAKIRRAYMEEEVIDVEILSASCYLFEHGWRRSPMFNSAMRDIEARVMRTACPGATAWMDTAKRFVRKHEVRQIHDRLRETEGELRDVEEIGEEKTREIQAAEDLVHAKKSELLDLHKFREDLRGKVRELRESERVIRARDKEERTERRKREREKRIEKRKAELRAIVEERKREYDASVEMERRENREMDEETESEVSETEMEVDEDGDG